MLFAHIIFVPLAPQDFFPGVGKLGGLGDVSAQRRPGTEPGRYMGAKPPEGDNVFENDA